MIKRYGDCACLPFRLLTYVYALRYGFLAGDLLRGAVLDIETECRARSVGCVDAIRLRKKIVRM